MVDFCFGVVDNACLIPFITIFSAVMKFFGVSKTAGVGAPRLFMLMEWCSIPLDVLLQVGRLVSCHHVAPLQCALTVNRFCIELFTPLFYL